MNGKGCFGSGVITSERAKRGGRTKERAMPTLNQLIRHGREENGARTVLELRINVPRSKEYARVFQREHRKT